MRITHFSVKPRTVARGGVLTFTTAAQGIRLSYKHIGKKPVAGEGHVQFYLDHVPKDAWSRADTGDTYLASAGTSVSIFGLKGSPAKFTPGRHRIIAALAENNGILYHAPLARVAITVR